METYIMLTKLTDEGRKTLKNNPKRTQEVNKEVEAMGGKVLAQYAVLGPYDFVNVLQAPNHRTIAKISVELGARGTMEIMTLPGGRPGLAPRRRPGDTNPRASSHPRRSWC